MASLDEIGRRDLVAELPDLDRWTEGLRKWLVKEARAQDEPPVRRTIFEHPQFSGAYLSTTVRPGTTQATAWEHLSSNHGTSCRACGVARALVLLEQAWLEERGLAPMRRWIAELKKAARALGRLGRESDRFRKDLSARFERALASHQREPGEFGNQGPQDEPVYGSAGAVAGGAERLVAELRAEIRAVASKYLFANPEEDAWLAGVEGVLAGHGFGDTEIGQLIDDRASAQTTSSKRHRADRVRRRRERLAALQNRVVER